MSMVATEIPVKYVTEPWDEHATALQNTVDSDASLLAAADVAHNVNLHYTLPAEARFVQDASTVGRGKILGKVIFPLRPRDISSQIVHAQEARHPLHAHRVKRFAVVVTQKAPELQGEFRFIPISELPKNQDPGSLKTLSFETVIRMIKYAGGDAQSISHALEAITPSTIWSNTRKWKDHGGNPKRRGSIKRRKTSYHFHASPRAIELKRKKHLEITNV